MEPKDLEFEEPNKPSASTVAKNKEKSGDLPIGQLFLKIIAAQIEVNEDEPKFSQQIQDVESEHFVQIKFDHLTYETQPAEGSLVPQWHAGYTFAVRDPNTSLKLKLISTKKLINTTLGKVTIALDTITEDCRAVEVSLQNICKKIKSVKLSIALRYISDDAEILARKYSVIKERGTIKRMEKPKFAHLNHYYFTKNGITKEHPSFKIVLEKASFFAGEIVRGAIIFDIARTIDHIEYIKLIATCREYCFWSDGEGDRHLASDGKVHFAIEKYITSTPTKNRETLGTHVYPFELQLPARSPSSLGYDGANVVYSVTAECYSPQSKFDDKKETVTALFNVYGTESKFGSDDLPFHIRKHLKDNWTGEVLLSSQKQYPNKEYNMLIKYHNVKRHPVKEIGVCFKLHKIMRGFCASEPEVETTRERNFVLLRETIPMKYTTKEHIEVDYKYTMPVVPPTVCPRDGRDLFEFYTVATVTLTLASGKKKQRAVPITVGTIIPEHVTQEHHVINPDASVASLTVYCAKSSMVHGLVCYKSTSLQFFDDKIFTSYDNSNLVRIEHGVAISQEDFSDEKSLQQK